MRSMSWAWAFGFPLSLTSRSSRSGAALTAARRLSATCSAVDFAECRTGSIGERGAPPQELLPRSVQLHLRLAARPHFHPTQGPHLRRRPATAHIAGHRLVGPPVAVLADQGVVEGPHRLRPLALLQALLLSLDPRLNHPVMGRTGLRLAPATVLRRLGSTLEPVAKGALGDPQPPGPRSERCDRTRRSGPAHTPDLPPATWSCPAPLAEGRFLQGWRRATDRGVRESRCPSRAKIGGFLTPFSPCPCFDAKRPAELGLVEPRPVRMVYFLPNDRASGGTP